MSFICFTHDTATNDYSLVSCKNCPRRRLQGTDSGGAMLRDEITIASRDTVIDLRHLLCLIGAADFGSFFVISGMVGSPSGQVGPAVDPLRS